MKEKNHQSMQIKEMTTFAEMARMVNIKKIEARRGNAALVSTPTPEKGSSIVNSY